jgi:hypothetical protein
MPVVFDLQYGTDVSYTDSPDKHDFDHLNDPGKASPISHFMVTDELTTALGAKVILFAVAFFPVLGYVGTMATGRLISVVVSIIS